MQNKKLTESVYYVGADDKTLDLFEGQYVIPEGISYNSYVIMDDKIAVMDTVDKRATDEWFQNLEEVLNGKEPDYLVILHMEPDHAANIEHFLNRYKKAKVVSNPKTFNMIPQFFEHLDLEGRKVVVNEGDELSLGSHTLTFVMAPMVHWPEVMVAYEKKKKSCFRQMLSENSARLTLRTNGIAKHAAIISILSANTAHRYRRCLKRRQLLIFRRFLPCTGRC